MGRKKKKEELEIHHTSLGGTVDPPLYDLSPYTIMPDIGAPEVTEITSLSDNIRRYTVATHPGTSITYTGPTRDARTIYHPPTHWEPFSTTLDYEDFRIKVEEEKKLKEAEDMNIKVKHENEEYIAYCVGLEDLSVERVLKTLSVVKARLMMEIAPIHIQKLECSMTCKVKDNIVTASKRLRMYGKKRPIVACFDDFGRPLPDTIDLDTHEGITLKLVNEKDYGEYYLELKAIEFPATTYTPAWQNSYLSEEDLPF